MDAFDIVRLVGVCIALVLGAIIFLVVFFRGMSWLDRWIKKRNEADQRPPRKRNGNRPRRPKSSDWDSLVRQRPSDIAQPDVRPLVASRAELESVTKPINRIATVHLLSGETIERVAFSSKEKATKICDGLGFEGVVFENDDGQVFVVREINIKMVTWKAG